MFFDNKSSLARRALLGNDEVPFSPFSATYDEVVKSICDQVGAVTTHSPDETCRDYISERYERNMEPYRYDTTNPFYTPQYLDTFDAPRTPEDVERLFQNVLRPYKIKYIRPKVKYVATFEPSYPNGVEAFNWTHREENHNLPYEMSKYMVDRFLYETNIPLTTYPNTELTMYLDGNRYLDPEILTHEYKHVIELPILQNLMYIYGLNEFRKMDHSICGVRGNDWCTDVLTTKLKKWKEHHEKDIRAFLKNCQWRLDFMENESTIGQHRYNNVPLLQKAYENYLPGILK